MNAVSLATVAAAGLVAAVAAGPRAVAADEAAPAARVNGVVILQSRLDRALAAYLEQGQRAAGAADPSVRQQMKRQVLDVLIGRELLWQDAKAAGVEVSDDEVAQTLDRLSRRFGSAAEFESKLREGGWTRETYAEELKHRLSVHRLVNEHLSKSIDITDDEVEAFYRQNLDSFQRPGEVRARHILLQLAPDAPQSEEDAVLARIDGLQAQLASGTDFAELAKTASEGPSGASGGDLGFFGPGRMVPPFEKAAFALQPGQVSGPVRTRFGYHLIKVEERRGGDPAPLDEVSDAIRQRLYGMEQQRIAQDHADALRESADIETLVDLGTRSP